MSIAVWFGLAYLRSKPDATLSAKSVGRRLTQAAKALDSMLRAGGSPIQGEPAKRPIPLLRCPWHVYSQ
jgi:hypothetical protein